MQQQNPRVDFFSGKKRLRRIQNGVFPFTVVEFSLQLPFIRLEEAVSWTQHFLTRKIWPKNEVYLWQRNLKANVFRNSTFQVNTRKNATSRRRQVCHFKFVSTSCEERHNKPFRLWTWRVNRKQQSSSFLLSQLRPAPHPPSRATTGNLPSSFQSRGRESANFAQPWDRAQLEFTVALRDKKY